MSRVRTRCEGEADSPQLITLIANAGWKKSSMEDRQEYDAGMMKLKAVCAEQLSDYRESGFYRNPIA